MSLQAYLHTRSPPPPSIETHLAVVWGSHQEVSTQARQQEEVVGASLLCPRRTNRSSYVNAKDLIRC